jgi:hypothetical protein
MRVGILNPGTRGEVQPVVALAVGLQTCNYKPFVAVSPDHKNFVESCGLEFIPLGEDSSVFMDDYLSGKDMTVRIEEFYTKANDDAWDICERLKPDVLVYSSGLGVIGLAIAEKLAIPAVQFEFAPWDPNVTFANIYESVEKIGSSWEKSIQCWLSQIFLIDTFAGGTTPRTATTLKRMQYNHPVSAFGYWKVRRDNGIPKLHGWSPSVLNPDWKSTNNFTTGYWFVPLEKEHYTPPQIS